MYPNGELVTLVTEKFHGEGENAVRLASGVCGIVTHCGRSSDGSHLYTVDFGAYGGWYCTESELSGNNIEGWDTEVESDNVDEILSYSEGVSIIEHNTDYIFPSIDQTAPVSIELTDKERKEAGFVKIDLEADIKKRMKAIERGE